MKRTWLTAFTGMVIFASFSAPVCAAALQADIAIPYRSITSLEESTIEKTAIIAVSNIVLARADIHRKALARAGQDISEASRLMETIENDLSTATPRNLIRIARRRLEFERPEEVLRDFPPIVRSLRMSSIYLPTDKAEHHVIRARESLERQDKRGAGRELALAEKSLLIIEVDLPLLKAQHNVAAAQGYLAAGQAGQADKALNLAAQKTMALYSLVSSPLVQAQRNLWLAYANYSTEKKYDVGPFLERATGKLGEAALGGNESVKEETGKLSLEISDLKKKLEGGGTIAEASFGSVWAKCRALVERSAAYLAADVSKDETTLKGDNNLIEAKLHLDYAEIYQVTSSEPDKAVRELDSAAGRIRREAASVLTSVKDKKKLKAMESSIQLLKADVDKRGEAVTERYESLGQELSAMIQRL